MTVMDAGCIDLTVTSPPYDNLRNYKGYKFDLENIVQGLYRVTKLGGIVVETAGNYKKGKLLCPQCTKDLYPSQLWYRR